MCTFVECLLKTGKWIETFSEIQMLVEEFQQNTLVCFERWMFIERSESGFLNGGEGFYLLSYMEVRSGYVMRNIKVMRM